MKERRKQAGRAGRTCSDTVTVVLDALLYFLVYILIRPLHSPRVRFIPLTPAVLHTDAVHDKIRST